jgi:hypothetical protein
MQADGTTPAAWCGAAEVIGLVDTHRLIARPNLFRDSLV